MSIFDIGLTSSSSPRRKSSRGTGVDDGVASILVERIGVLVGIKAKF